MAEHTVSFAVRVLTRSGETMFGSQIEYIDPSELKPDPHQPRKNFTDDGVSELAKSFKNQGIIYPIEVDENNVIILGERRWKAALRAGVKVPIRRRTGLSRKEKLERQLTDDAHRSDLTPQERVWAYATGVLNINEQVNYTLEQVHQMGREFLSKKLQEKPGISALSETIGVPEATIATYLSYFKVGPDLQEAFENGRVKLDYLYETSKLSDFPEAKAELEQLVLENRFRTRDEIRDYIKQFRQKQTEATIEIAKEMISVSVPEVKLETPEEVEVAIKVLRKKAEELKSHEQILEEKRDKARKSLLTGKQNALSKVEKARELGIDTTEFEGRIEEIKAKIDTDPDEAYEEVKKLKKDIGAAIKDEEERSKVEQIREEERKRAEETKLEDLVRDHPEAAQEVIIDVRRKG